MPPLFAEADLPNRGIIWSRFMSQQELPNILARAEPTDGVPRKGVHTVIVATVLSGITIFIVGLAVIYRLYMRKIDREELRRRSHFKKDGTAKGPIAPKPRKTRQKISSHSIRGNIPLISRAK